MAGKEGQGRGCYLHQINKLLRFQCGLCESQSPPTDHKAKRLLSNDPFSHRRRGSTLKVVMRKLFGIKRHSNNLDSEEGSESPSTVKRQPLATPTGLNGPSFQTAHKSDSSSGRSVSRRKQSVPASQLSSASSDQIVTTAEDKRIEIPARTVRRRATLPSLILTEDGDPKGSIYSGLSPTSTRPVSMVNESREENEHHEDYEDSKSQPSLRAHRRSRSADALRDLVRHHRMSPIQWRRRSDEIKFWRTSVLEMEEPHDEGEAQPSNSNRKPRIDSLPENQEPKSAKEDNLPLVNEPTSPPFQFENLIASMADPDATVEQRLTTIEVKLMDLEFAISKIQGTDSNVFSKSPEIPMGQRNATLSPNSAAKSLNDASSIVSEVSTQSSASFGGGEDRPISTATLRPNMVYSQPPPWQNNSWSSMNLNGISIEQYSALVTLVRREQTARKALENQVTQLQEEIQQIRRASGLPASPPGTLYPIPSPDSDDGKFQRRHTGSSRKDSRTSADTRGSDTRTQDSSRYRHTSELASGHDSNMI
ncbi:conserved hypothetical protein [Talaromyces stipitatus ATCC 10500]|uniref:Uncharacterized protein n=1 Tax=Talaromyces stipitatus (strain ATCC 10500 / CBS 375.48 / QM 6759 / NRRL 1006) TaxID=441959 RepID=B8M4G9_TALSN|nr:uncharacterized protein TSTA_024860 [Talaromyces stipitatus ATCC 10500]EED19164.1 conserved hypothetical protein [Talaromyces stipitatus ATCC 10500]